MWRAMSVARMQRMMPSRMVLQERARETEVSAKFMWKTERSHAFAIHASIKRLSQLPILQGQWGRKYAHTHTVLHVS